MYIYSYVVYNRLKHAAIYVVYDIGTWASQSSHARNFHNTLDIHTQRATPLKF